MMSTEKMRKKFHISVIDILIIITLIVCLAGTFVHYKIFEKNNKVNTDDTCLISVLFAGVDPTVAEQIADGDKLYMKKNGEVFGVVNEVELSDAQAYYTNEEHKIVEGKDPTKKDIKIIVRVSGDVTEKGFLVNGTDYIASGMNANLFSSSFSGKGLIFDVKQQTE